jgi:hypothetical protein
MTRSERSAKNRKSGDVKPFRLVAIIWSFAINIHRREILVDIRTRLKGMWRLSKAPRAN